MKKYSKETLNVVLKMALPAIIESFFVSFAGMVDSFMVSSLGSDAVAAVGITTQPKFVGLAVFMAVSVSVSALVARRLGEKKREEANSIMLTAIMLVSLLSIVFGVIATVYAPNIIQWCGSTKETHNDAVTYFRIIMLFIFFNCMQICINAMQRGAGNTKITMRTNITSNTINIIGNYLLIGGNFGFPALGIRGAAIATVFGTVVSFFMSIFSILNKNCFISIPYALKHKIKPSLVALSSIFHVGYSVFLEQLLMRIGFMATAIMAAKQGNNAMAAHQVSLHLLSLSFAFGDGLQAASVALIGRSLGEKNPDLAKTYGGAVQLIGAFFSVIISLVYILLAEKIMSMFFSEPGIVRLGTYVTYLVVLAVFFQIRQCIYMGSLRGAGDTHYTAFTAASSVVIVRTLVSYVCCYVLKMGLFGIWLGIVGDQVTRFIFSMVRFKRGKWVNIKI